MKFLKRLFKRKRPTQVLNEILRTTKGDLSIFYNVKGERIRGFSNTYKHYEPFHWSEKYPK